MKILLVNTCLSKQTIVKVLEEDRPNQINNNQIFAVFKNSIEIGIFCGLVTDSNIALHPNWIFADLCEHNPTLFVLSDTEISNASNLMEQNNLHVLAVLDHSKSFVGVITKTSILDSLLLRERQLLKHSKKLKAQLESEHEEVVAWSKKMLDLHSASRSLLAVLAHTSVETDLLEAGIKALADLLQARYGAIGILDNTGTLTTFVHTGLSDKQVNDIGHLPTGEGLLGVIINEDVSLLLEDMSKDPRSVGFPPNHPPMKSLLAVPISGISHTGKVYGRIYLSDKYSGKPFNKNDEQLAKSFAYSLSLVIENAKEIEELKRVQKDLDYMAHYDSLTGLPNRILFTDRFYQSLAHTKRAQCKLAICFLDLDNFKSVNDNFGHESGDKLLIEVSNRILSIVREEDTVSRQGGDEFVILLNDIHSIEQCEQTLKRIHQALAQPYLINNCSHQITASSGITIYPMDKEDLDTLLRHADQAMYQAKISGRDKYNFFNTEYNRQIEKTHHDLTEIKNALLNHEMCLYYQPKVNMRTGNVFGVEALIRWNNPKKGLIPPLEFLPIIESTDIDIDIGNWVIEQALIQLQQLPSQKTQLEISVNISSYHLLSTGFIAQLEQLLVKYPSVDTNFLQFEILESTVLHDVQAIGNIINVCQDKFNIKFSLDDFGTGYSSLTHLRNLAADIIKIDQTFVRNILDDPNDYAIVDGIIALANSFDREIIAEGVETTEHGIMLLLIGCENAQGYGIARPMPMKEFLDWFSKYKPNPEWENYSKKQLSLKEKKILIFKLTSEHWSKKFINNFSVHTGNDIAVWPIMDYKLCHCSYWIKRARQEHLFEQLWLDKLEQSYTKLHDIANDILSKYQDNKLDTPDINMDTLQYAIDNITNILQQYDDPSL